jgi:AraC-like DNA-binding protein
MQGVARPAPAPHESALLWTRPHMVSLAATSAFKVAEYRCPAHDDGGPVERASFPEIVLPRVGSYLRCDEMDEVLLNRSTLAFFEADMPYTIRHFRKAPDISTVISITDTASLHEALGIRLPMGRAFARSAVRMPPDIMLSHRSLLREVRAGGKGSLAADEIAAGIILRSISLNVADRRELARRRHEPRAQRDAYAYADAVMQFLATAYPGRVTLEQVAKAVGLSAFHLCRVFQSATRDTIRQHLLSLRLEAAAVELLETRKSITEVALSVGFSSHSHMTAMFTRTFGMPPSQLRDARGVRLPGLAGTARRRLGRSAD